MVHMKSEVLMDSIKIEHFDLQHIFDCGQSFRWEKVGDHDYIGIAGERVLRLTQNEDSLSMSCSVETFDKDWAHYFDMETDYETIKKNLLLRDPTLEDAIQFGSGIRLLNQDPFEMLITFILSANNHIPRIKSLVKRLSENYGTPVDHPWVELVGPMYTFPSPEALSHASVGDLRSLGLGYRDRYVFESAQKVAETPEILEKIQQMPYEQAKKALLEFSGVGPKVADCILLFSAGKHEAFPIDTWIKKTLQRRYGLEKLSPKALEDWINQKFGELKGYAQQYLFFYERERNE